MSEAGDSMSRPRQEEVGKGFQQKPVKEWDKDDVYAWAIKYVPEDEAKKLLNGKINGEGLIEMEKKDFKELCGIEIANYILMLNKEKEKLLKDKKEEQTHSFTDEKQTQLEEGASSNHKADGKKEKKLEDPKSKTLVDFLNEKVKDVTFNLMNEGSENTNQYNIKHIFAKKGEGANRLDKKYIFLLLTAKETAGAVKKEWPSKLWDEIKKHTKDKWYHYMGEQDLFHKNKDGEICDERDNELELGSGKNIPIKWLESLKLEHYEDPTVILLMDKSLQKKNNRLIEGSFALDLYLKKKIHFCFKNVNPYQGLFDQQNPSTGLSFDGVAPSPCTNEVTKQIENTKTLPSTNTEDEKPLGNPDFLDTPRRIDTDGDKWLYQQGHILNCNETGPKDLLRPVHEFKLFENASKVSEKDKILKFVKDTLEFACGCLNTRTNGIIHFGVADEIPKNAEKFNKSPKEIVGVEVSDKTVYIDKLSHCIHKCFGKSDTIANQCIRPPQFIQTRPKDMQTEHGQICRYVIEIDIVPFSGYCEDTDFTVTLPKNNLKEFEVGQVFVRDGANTRPIQDNKLGEFFKTLPKTTKAREDAERQSRETTTEQKEELTRKLQRLLCLNGNILDTSYKRILLISKPDYPFAVTEKEFGFLKCIDFDLVIDFDNEADEKDAGICSLVSKATKFKIRELQDFEEKGVRVENILENRVWAFGNGWKCAGHERCEPDEFDSSNNMKGLTKVLQCLFEKCGNRTIILFLIQLPSVDIMSMVHREIKKYFSPNQMLYICESHTNFDTWNNFLQPQYIKTAKLQERSVVDIELSLINQAVKYATQGYPLNKLFVPGPNGTLEEYSRNSIDKDVITVLNAKECEGLGSLTHEESKKQSQEEEKRFYSGQPLSWKNLWFTDYGNERHVLSRDCFKVLAEKVSQALSYDGNSPRVKTVTLYHQKSTGATTVLRQVLWRYSRQSNPYQCRCCIVRKITDSTKNEILKFHTRQSKALPVLVLVDDQDENLLNHLGAQILEEANQIENCQNMVVVFLCGVRCQSPKYKADMDSDDCTYIRNGLTEEEYENFKRKFEEIQERLGLDLKEFETYAEKSLLSFRILMCPDANARKRYVQQIVAQALPYFSDKEHSLIKYLALLNICYFNPVFVPCFDILMTSRDWLKKKYPANWVGEILDGAGQLLRFTDGSEHYRTGMMVSLKHTLIAECVLDYIMEEKQEDLSTVCITFLLSGILLADDTAPIRHLREVVKKILLERVPKTENEKSRPSKFSPLIEKIIKQTRKTLQKNDVLKAIEVLDTALGIFKKAPSCQQIEESLCQHIARVYYINAKAWSQEEVVEKCFNKAVEFVDQGLEIKRNSILMNDTKARIYKKEMEMLFGKIQRHHEKLDMTEACVAMGLAFKSMKLFQTSRKYRQKLEQIADFGELSVIFDLLEILTCVGVFRKKTNLWKYLTQENFIPEEIEVPWAEYHTGMKQLQKQCDLYLQELDEELTIFKNHTVGQYYDGRKELSFYRANYVDFFCHPDVQEKDADSPMTFEELRKFTWFQINKYTAGGLFHGIFNASFVTKEADTVTTLKRLKNLIEKLFLDKKYEFHSKDAIAMITTKMALCSPHRAFSSTNEDYRHIYNLVERYYNAENKIGSKSLYAYLFRVMFLWPHQEREILPDDYNPELFKEALSKLWDTASKKSVGREEPKNVDQLYRQMTSSDVRRKRNFTTLFYLGKGKGLYVFVHINELKKASKMPGKGIHWNGGDVKKLLKNCKGTRISNDKIAMVNIYDKANKITIIVDSRDRDERFSKGEVTFYLGFSWQGPIAVNIENTRGIEEIEEEQGGDDEDYQSYSQYCKDWKTYTQKIEEIEELKKKQVGDLKLEKNQLDKIKKEVEWRRKRKELEEKYNAAHADDYDD